MSKLYDKGVIKSNNNKISPKSIPLTANLMDIEEIEEIAYVDKKERKNTDNGGGRSTRETNMCFLLMKM
ncbi:MAG: hypothetical protein IJ599_03855 [Alphaproteobacteria bacterium]|nr:hypothetical protein [Alphaproteobacteria bacterium]